MAWKHLESLISQYDPSLWRSIIVKKIADGISPYMEMKRERLQLSFTMFLKKMPGVQFVEQVPRPSTFSTSSEAAVDISSTSSIL